MGHTARQSQCDRVRFDEDSHPVKTKLTNEPGALAAMWMPR